MKTAVEYKRKIYPVVVYAIYGENCEMRYDGCTMESYDCADEQRRNFTGVGSTLRDCLANILLKIVTHQPN